MTIYERLAIMTTGRQTIMKAQLRKDNPIGDTGMPGHKPKKKKSFPDLSGDGKTTFKDILIGRGIIKKKKKTKKKTRRK